VEALDYVLGQLFEEYSVVVVVENETLEQKRMKRWEFEVVAGSLAVVTEIGIVGIAGVSLMILQVVVGVVGSTKQS
jgi:hypothetical protein